MLSVTLAGRHALAAPRLRRPASPLVAKPGSVQGRDVLELLRRERLALGERRQTGVEQREEAAQALEARGHECAALAGATGAALAGARAFVDGDQNLADVEAV